MPGLGRWGVRTARRMRWRSKTAGKSSASPATAAARGINNSGQVVGTALIGGQTRAVPLTPGGNVSWQAGTDGSFADATRWAQNFVPSRFLDASIDSAGLQTVFVNQTSSVKNLTLGADAGITGRPTLLMTGGMALQVAGLFTLRPTGTVAGETLRINGAGHSNAGVIDIRAGGEQQYSGALANAAGGRILLNDAVLRLNNGLINAGQVQVSFGGATVYGSVAIMSGGKVILSGTSQTMFLDTVSVDAGGELRVSNGSTGVFFGPVTQRTGALFAGTGSKFYEGGLAIGASPGLGLNAGSVNFGVGNPYTAEIGGITACTAACATDAALRDRRFRQVDRQRPAGLRRQVEAGVVGRLHGPAGPTLRPFRLGQQQQQ